MSISPKQLVPLSVRDFVRLRAKHYAYDHTYPGAYRKAAKAPVDERKAVFVETVQPKLTSSMQRVYDEMLARGFTCEFISLHMNSGDFSVYSGQSAKMAQMVATAKLVFICDVCPPLAVLPLRPQTKVVQLWHGCGAFKKFGMSTADKIFGSSRKEKERYPEYRNTALVTVSSSEVVWAYEEAMGLEGHPGVVQPLGVSRTDAFFDESQLVWWRAEVNTAIPQTMGKKVLLYAPTFRGRVASAQAPDFLDFELLHERLGDDWVVLVKHHPFVRNRPVIPASCREFAFDVSDSLSIEAAMVASDVCVSDYSSLVFEYSLLQRPMAFLAPDRDDYDDWRGFYYDYDQMTPGPVFTTTEELADWVVQVDKQFDPAEVVAFRRKFMDSCDGHATERIVAAALEDRAPTDDVVPLDAVEETTLTNANDPDMTVVVPVYNSAQYLARCVSSLDAQTAGQASFEVVLVNDGSTDESRAICERLVAAHANYVLINQQNKGVSAARNVGIRAAHGRYIMFLDPDDTLSPTSIAGLVEAFDSFGDDVDLVTYPLTYHDMDTGYEHRNARYKWMGETGVYRLDGHPFVAQTTINVCIRNRGKNTPLFDETRAHYEDQVFNTCLLAQKCAIGFCADAEYTYYREPSSVTMARDTPEDSFDDVMSAFELFFVLAAEHEGIARYAYALILYNVAWRMREHKLLPDFGSEARREANYRRLESMLRVLPRSSWEENPYLSDMQRLTLMRRFGVVGDIVGVSYDEVGTHVEFDDETKMSLGVPRGIVTWALRKSDCTVVKGFVYGPTLEDAPSVTLRLRLGGRELPLRTVCKDTGYEDNGIPVRCAWHFEATLPAMQQRSFAARLVGAVGEQSVPVFDLRFDVCRSNGRRINITTREFGDRRMELEGGAMRVGTIKDLPAWTMPVVTRLMQGREKSREGDYDHAEVDGLRERLPRAIASFVNERMWLYVHAPQALERDAGLCDGVVRIRMEDLKTDDAKVLAFLISEKIISADLVLAGMLPCDLRTWDRIADFTADQEYEYVGDATDLTGTPYDTP